MENFPFLRELSRLFIRPKETIRKIVAVDPNRYFLWMATLYGFWWMLAGTAAQHLERIITRYITSWLRRFFATAVAVY